MTDDLKAEYDEYRAKREAATCQFNQWCWKHDRSTLHFSMPDLDVMFAFMNHAANSDLHEKLWEEVERLEAYTTTLLGHIGDFGKAIDLQNAEIERLRKETIHNTPVEWVRNDYPAPEGGDAT